MELGFGCAPIGGMFTSVSNDEAAATLEEAWRLGIRTYDTAPLYGLGTAEERLGRMLADKPRDEVVVSTKVGRLVRSGVASSHDVSAWVDRGDRVAVFDFSYDGVMRSFEESLGRLGLDRIDVLHIHDPDDHFDDAVVGAYRALQVLKGQGVVGAIGAGMNQHELLSRLMNAGDFDVFLLAGRHTLLEPTDALPFLDRCAAAGVRVFCGGVFNSGLLAGGVTYDYATAPPEVLERARELSRRCEAAGVPLKAAALLFPTRHPAVAAVLSGARTPEEIAENAELFATAISEESWDAITTEAP